MALRREVVQLIRCKAVNEIQYPLGAGEIAVMQEEPRARLIRMLINEVDAPGIECARPADDPMDFVPFGKQEFREIRAVWSGNSRNQCAFHWRSVWPRVFPQ